MPCASSIPGFFHFAVYIDGVSVLFPSATAAGAARHFVALVFLTFFHPGRMNDMSNDKDVDSKEGD
jgi:hypothetical protein